MDNNVFFKYVKSAGEYMLVEYLQKDNPEIREIEIPAVYNEQRVRFVFDHSFKGARYLEKVVVSEGITAIGKGAFADSGLHSVAFPQSLLTVGEEAFARCAELEDVLFASSASLTDNVFFDCPKISAETRLMDFFHCTDLNVISTLHPLIRRSREYNMSILREDVLRLGVALGVFDEIDREFIIDACFRRGLISLLPIVEDWFDVSMMKRFLTFSLEAKKPEFTAYLLELKHHKFGFGVEGFEL